MLLIFLLLGATACKEEKRISPVKNPLTERDSDRTPPSYPLLAPKDEEGNLPEPPVDSAELRRKFESIKKEALAQLQPLIRRFDRKKRAYIISEQGYLEKLYLWMLTFSLLEARSNPGTFAGELPEHEMFSYSDFVESAESLLVDLDVYLDRYSEKSDPQYDEIMRTRQEAIEATTLSYPGTGSRLEDAIVAMRSEKFKAVVNETNPRLTTLATVGGVQVIDSMSGGLQKALKFLDGALHSGKQ
jgi:hypothetical protein